MNTTNLLNKLADRKNITTAETAAFVDEVIKGNISAVQLAAILTAFRMKGETSDEIVGFIQAMRKHRITIQATDVIDVCGTGGDGSNTFNISTTVAFVVAGCGVKVAKHGNRAASSQSGSADVLEALGVKVDLTAEQAENVLKKVGMVFLFAPLYHPAFKEVSMIRKELGIRTVFNFLGPFANPALVKRQLIGMPSYEIAKKMTDVATKLSYKHIILVASEDGMDEISLFAKTHVFDIKGKNVKEFLLDPRTFGFKKDSKQTICGGDAKANAAIIRQILNGELKDTKWDIVILNSACALVAADVAKNIPQGLKLAEESIDSGRAQSVLDNLIKETQKYAK